MSLLDSAGNLEGMEITAPSRTLDELANAARSELDATASHLFGALAHYIALGEVLLEAKTHFDSSATFRTWCAGIGVGPSDISNSMRLAHYRDHIPSEVFDVWRSTDDGKLRNPSINRALTYVRGLPDISPRTTRPADSSVNEARRLIREGLPTSEVAAILGVSKTTVRNWINPDQAKIQARRNRERRRRERAAIKKDRLQREAADRAGSAGGDLSETYALIRRALVSADKAGADDAVRALHRAEESVIELMRKQREIAA